MVIDYLTQAHEGRRGADQMTNFIIQYAYPTSSKICISDWIEKTTLVKADNIKSACKEFNKTHQHLGTWDIRDCYEVQS